MNHDVKVGVEDTVEGDAIETGDQCLGTPRYFLRRHPIGLPSDGGSEPGHPPLVVSQDATPQLGVVAAAGDGEADVDPGQLALLGHESDVGLDQLGEGVGPTMFGVGVDGVDGRPHHGEDDLLFGIEQVVEAAGKDTGLGTDGLDGGAFEPGVGDEPSGGLEDSVPRLETSLVSHSREIRGRVHLG